MVTSQQKMLLVNAVGELRRSHSAAVMALEAEATNRWRLIRNNQEPFWLWNAVLQAAATNGGSRHWDSIKFLKREFKTRSGADPFGWENITACDPETLEMWLGVAANPHYQRWRQIKERLVMFVSAYREKQLAPLMDQIIESDRNACISILIRVPGVNQKYARNLLMDVGHPEFMDGSFALDSRIRNFLLKNTGVGHTYSRTSANSWTECQLVSVARECCLTAWQMDRLIYQYS